MGSGTQIGRIFRPLVDFAYPPRCPLCGDALGGQDGLCVECWATLEQPGGNGCASCGLPLPPDLAGEDAAQCAPCLKQQPRHAGILAATFYNAPSRKLVLALKHGGRIGLARMMARLMAARLEPVPPDALLIPVPLHRWRLWRRGYNQSALLAAEISRVTGHGMLVDGLQRKKATPTLGGLGRKQRAKVLQGAISVVPRRRPIIEGRSVVLVDDVLTSGATSDACVSALLKAGASDVTIACFARVVDGIGSSSFATEFRAPNETPEAPLGTPGAA